MALDHSLGPGTVLSYFSAAQASRKYARECIAAHFVVFKLTLTHGDLCAILLIDFTFSYLVLCLKDLARVKLEPNYESNLVTSKNLQTP